MIAELFCMVCCTRYCAAEAQLGRKRAERDLRRYHRRGVRGITEVWACACRSVLDLYRRESAVLQGSER